MVGTDISHNLFFNLLLNKKFDYLVLIFAFKSTIYWT